MVFWTQLPLQGVPGYLFLNASAFVPPTPGPWQSKVLSEGWLLPQGGWALQSSVHQCKRLANDFRWCLHQALHWSGCSSQLGAHGGLLAGLAVSRVPHLEGAIGRKCFILSWCCEEIHAASAETGIFNFYMSLLMFFKHFHLEKTLMFREKSVLDGVSLILE